MRPMGTVLLNPDFHDKMKALAVSDSTFRFYLRLRFFADEDGVVDLDLDELAIDCWGKKKNVGRKLQTAISELQKKQLIEIHGRMIYAPFMFMETTTKYRVKRNNRRRAFMTSEPTPNFSHGSILPSESENRLSQNTLLSRDPENRLSHGSKEKTEANDLNYLEEIVGQTSAIGFGFGLGKALGLRENGKIPPSEKELKEKEREPEESFLEFEESLLANSRDVSPNTLKEELEESRVARVEKTYTADRTVYREFLEAFVTQSDQRLFKDWLSNRMISQAIMAYPNPNDLWEFFLEPVLIKLQTVVERPEWRRYAMAAWNQGVRQKMYP
jgi:hypothetical protein